MKYLQHFAIVFMFLFSLTSCSSSDATEETTSTPSIALRTYTHSTYELELLDLVNQDRVGKGLNALQIVSEISYLSSTHDDYMISNNVVNHDNFEIRKNTLQNQIGAITVGENIAYAYNSAASTLNAWNNSVSHKANLEGNWTHFGLAVKTNAEGKRYYTLIFIKK